MSEPSAKRLRFDNESSDSERDEPAPNIPSSASVQKETVLDVDGASQHLKRAEKFLQNGQLSWAYAEAKQVCDNDETGRSLFILGDAAYGRRKWELAVGHYKELCEKFPANGDAKERVTRAQSRLAESRTSVYDIGKLYESKEKGEIDIDVADFMGPVEVVDVHGKGKGIVATQDVKKGTLLMANSPEAVAQAVADKLQLRPEMAAEINALYDGNEHAPGAPIDQGIPDIERLNQICKYGFDVRGEQRGLWILPSYFNFSCLSNAHFTFYGDVATFFAVTDIKKGGEVTIRCLNDAFARFDLREKVYSENYGFACSCRLCELDRADPRYEERQKLIAQALQQHAMTCFLFSPSRGIGVLTPLLKLLRATYKNRKELRTQMCEPLRSLAMDYRRTRKKDRYENALKRFVELAQCLDESLLSWEGACLYLKIAECYDNMKDEANARKYARMAADVDRICTGSDDALFKKTHKKVAEFAHLL
ncbi:hypothetical protein AAVH_35411 [Aphelenchoides avenae]|nr:hypothetical protein AAVH_35411 [Aphelenchus avenae]